MPAAAIREFEDRYGVRILEGYGQSEGTVVTTANPLHGVRKPGTVGLPLPGQEVRIVGDDDEPLKSGQVGEVTVRVRTLCVAISASPRKPPARCVAVGCTRATSAGSTTTATWCVVDRLKDMIIRGGENIYPKEIEDALVRASVRGRGRR